MQFVQKDVSKYRNTITQFLRDNSLYDCLSQNNQLSVLQQTFTLWEVFQIFIESNLEECLFWNKDIANYDGVFTTTDLIKVLLTLYGNAFNNRSSVQQQGPKMNIIEEEESEFHEEQIKQQEQWPNGLSDEQKLRLVYEMKTITVRQWFHLERDQHFGLVRGRMDESLFEASLRMIKINISRLIVIEPESQMLMGILHQKDILVFLMKGFTQYQEFQNKSTYVQQHQLLIQHCYAQQILNRDILVCHETRVFYTMLYNQKAYLIPIVNSNNQYIGQISRRDIILIIKNGLFELFSWSAKQLLLFLKEEKSKIPAYQLMSKQFFSMQQTIREVVENLVLSENSALISLTENNQIQAVITTADILKFILKEN